MKEFPQWFPNNECTFKIYLTQHPELIAKDEMFLGFEVYYADLLFDSSKKLYVVEAKCIRTEETKESQINQGISQLDNYCSFFHDFIKDKKEIIPVLALMIDHTVTISHLKHYQDKLRKLRNLDKEVQRRRDELKKIEAELEDFKRQIAKRTKEYTELIKLVSQIKYNPVSRKSKFDKHLDEQLEIELERCQKISGKVIAF